MLEASESNESLLFTVQADYTILPGGQILEFLKNRGCTSAYPLADPALKIRSDPKNDPLCYHGRPSARVIRGYKYIYSRYLEEFVANSKIKSHGRAVKYGIFSESFRSLLVDPSSAEFSEGLNYKICPCYRNVHFGINCHDLAFHRNLPLFVPILGGNVMRNAETILRKSPPKKDQHVADNVRVGTKMKSIRSVDCDYRTDKGVSEFTQTLIEQGFIALSELTKGDCKLDPLDEKDREIFHKDHWGSDSESEDCSDTVSNIGLEPSESESEITVLSDDCKR